MTFGTFAAKHPVEVRASCRKKKIIKFNEKFVIYTKFASSYKILNQTTYTKKYRNNLLSNSDQELDEVEGKRFRRKMTTPFRELQNLPNPEKSLLATSRTGSGKAKREEKESQ
ncbi:hypothetical protein RIR_jg4458.t1 [Rhizophagus irregularis DAOM 181602=DAOM 197198]|nr:hypothetical protein RhiirB3_391280 [Rhizophagus irregularis]GBC38094.2 hypothetical protein RIR_jg4458.t1 [Rhizophagus irregularis DAOM 181602=DAOM 197198]